MEPSTTPHIALLALGTNVGDRIKNIENALALIEQRCGTIATVSSLYETKPLVVPGIEQGPYFNMMLELHTSLPPSQLLATLLDIEKECGRTRQHEVHWGPRVLDLDIIVYDSLVTKGESPELPHPRFDERDFVLLPLKEIRPQFRDPRSNTPIDTLLSHLPAEAKTILQKIAYEHERKRTDSNSLR